MASIAVEIKAGGVALECHQRKVQELTEVITHHSPLFHRIALGHLGNIADAEDAVQDAFLSAFIHVNQFRGQAKMSTWLTTIVVNSARMKFRRRLSRPQVALHETDGKQDFPLEDMVPDTRPSPEEVYRKREIAETLAHASSRLSPVLRKTFQLRDVHGLSIRETAHLLGVPAGTVKARLARARVRLKEGIKKSFRKNTKPSTCTRHQ